MINKIVKNSILVSIICTPFILVIYYTIIDYKKSCIEKLYREISSNGFYGYVYYLNVDTLYSLKYQRKTVNSTQIIEFNGEKVLIQKKNHDYITYDFDTNCWGVVVDTFKKHQIHSIPYKRENENNSNILIQSNKKLSPKIKQSKYGIQCNC